MSNLYYMRGLPASGKTVAARAMLRNNSRMIRVSSKDMRNMMLCDAPWNTKVDGYINVSMKAAIQEALRSNRDVVIDDVNIGVDTSYSFDVKNVNVQTININTSMHTCIIRDATRGLRDFVGRDEIMNLAWQGKMWDQEHPDYVIFDLDGTLADISARRNLAGAKEKMNWDVFYDPDNIWLDQPRGDVFDMAAKAIKDGLKVVICSGRDDQTRAETTLWLNKYAGAHGLARDWWFRLIMRKHNDHTPDDQLKIHWLNNFLPKEKCKFVVDDRPRVIRAWRENGLEVVDVGNGVEF